jgi:hypothetical protein
MVRVIVPFAIGVGGLLVGCYYTKVLVRQLLKDREIQKKDLLTAGAVITAGPVAFCLSHGVGYYLVNSRWSSVPVSVMVGTAVTSYVYYVTSDHLYRA